MGRLDAPAGDATDAYVVHLAADAIVHIDVVVSSNVHIPQETWLEIIRPDGTSAWNTTAMSAGYTMQGQAGVWRIVLGTASGSGPYSIVLEGWSPQVWAVRTSDCMQPDAGDDQASALHVGDPAACKGYLGQTPNDDDPRDWYAFDAHAGQLANAHLAAVVGYGAHLRIDFHRPDGSLACSRPNLGYAWCPIDADGTWAVKIGPRHEFFDYWWQYTFVLGVA